MTRIEEKAAEWVDVLFRELYSRKGFDNWWDGIDDDIQEEIKETLAFRLWELLNNDEIERERQFLHSAGPSDAD